MKEKIKPNKLKEILKVLTQYDFSHKLLEFLYSKRGKYSTKELSELLDIKYQTIHRCIVRFKSLEIVRGEEKLGLSQLGLDFTKKCIKLEIDNNFLGVFSKKHTEEVLEVLKNKKVRWKALRQKIKIGSSSLKNIIDLLIENEVIRKVGNKYTITESGKTLLEKYKNLTETPLLPNYEIQMKFKGTISEKLLKTISANNAKNIIQEDHYFKHGWKQKLEEEYLRYRLEKPLKPSISTPIRCKLSWSKKTESPEIEGLRLLKRERETLEVKHPEILFFLNYFNAREVVKILKSRKVFETEDGFVINLDLIKKPKKNRFVEIKYIFRDRDRINEIINDMKNLIKRLNLPTKKSTSKTYLELYRR